jgi:hypothetical protein
VPSQRQPSTHESIQTESDDTMFRFWKKHPAEGGTEARLRSERALENAKHQRAEAEKIVDRVLLLGTENHFSGKIAYMIKTGKAS